MNTQPESWVKTLPANSQPVKFVCRYYDESDGVSSKCLDRAEAELLSKYGLTIFSVFEWNPNDPLAGYNEGADDARHALICAAKAGQPKNTPIFFALDFQPDVGQLDGQITEYFNGIWSVFKDSGYQVGVYGSFLVCSYAKSHWQNVVTAWWQTYAWSGGQIFGDYTVYQYQNDQYINGVNVDFNDAQSNGWSLIEVTDQEFKDMFNRLIAPDLEAEIQQRKAEAVAAAVKAVATKLGS